MILRFKTDRLPVFIEIFSFGILLYTWFFITSPQLWFYVNLLLLIPRVMSTTFVHNHAHLPTFRDKSSNFFIETILFFMSGMMTSKFKLHHNLGHHLHYMDPSKDPSKWVYKDGRNMSRLFYTLRYFTTHTYYTVKIGLENKKLLREFIVQETWFTAILVIMFIFKPYATLILIYTPMVIMWLLFIMVTYDDHVGLHSNNPLEASFTKTSKFINRIILNNGYHTAHHIRPGTHWSELPGFHSTLEPNIPQIEAHTSLNKFSHFLEKFKNHG